MIKARVFIVSDEFTYECPNNRSFLKTLIRYLNVKGEVAIADLLKGADCSIEPTSQFSHRRWNGFYTQVNFRISVEKMSQVTEEIKKKLATYCDEVIPPEVGYDIGSVYFSPQLESVEDDESFLEEISEVIQNTAAGSRSILPEDIWEKGKEMAEVYSILYCIENSLRLFIDQVFRNAVGEGYTEDQIKISSSIRKGIEQKKQQEQRHQWLSVRGDSYLFYLDFKELGSIISINWSIFGAYFPSVEWITVKINEMGECRNYIAHNSYIDAHERRVVQTNYISILRQIGAIE